MVSTRSHPSEFPPPELSPTKTLRSSRMSTPQPSLQLSALSAPFAAPSASSSAARSWSHTPSALTLIWLAVQSPLIVWDCGYVLLRPHTMPGGSLFWPLYVPYELYGTVDYAYGWPAYNAQNGFVGAQSALNVIELFGYLVYLWIVFAYGFKTPSGSFHVRELRGRWASIALLIGYATSVMTVSKTLLYWLTEYYSSWNDIGHNDLFSLVMLWMIPNGAWLIFPSYMAYEFGTSILNGLAVASGEPQKKRL